MPYEVIVGRTPADIEKLGKEGLIYIGKSYVSMGPTTSLTNKILMDVANSHVVLVAGKRGSGKCLLGDTLIPLNDGSLMPISEIANNQNKIFSLNEQLKISESEKSEFFEREVNKILKIKLRSGKEIQLTPEHPLMTIKGWKPAQELCIGSRIATERKIECFGKEEMPEHKIKLLAYLIAEGHLGNGFVLFTNSDEKIVNEFYECTSEFDSNLQIKSHGEYGYRVSQKDKLIKSHEINRNNKGQFSEGSGVRYQKNSLRLWLEKLDLYGKSSLEKFIPQKIFKLPKQQLALFLNRLFCCDGSIYKHKTANGEAWQASYCSSSEKMIKQIQHLLLRFSILSKLRKKYISLDNKSFESYELILSGENVLNFVKEIGFFGEKKEKQEKVLKEAAFVKRNPNVDTIPKEIWDIYKPKNWAEIGRAFDYKYPKAMRERIHYSPSRQTLLQIAEVEQSNPLMLLAKSDIFWDEIISIEMLEGNFKVYDICVPESHNFIANDIIVHNSYTLGVIAEEMAGLPSEVGSNIAVLIYDTMGIFWTMAYANEKETELLRSWNLEAKKLPVRIFVPYGYAEEYSKKGIPVTKGFALKVSELSPDDWVMTFGLDFLDSVAIAIQKVVSKLLSDLKEKGKEFDLDDLILAVKEDQQTAQATKNAAVNLFEAARTWGLFAQKGEAGTEIKEVIEGGKTSIIDLSAYSSIGTFNVRALVIGLLSKKLFNSRMEERKYEEVQSVRHGLEQSYKEKREMPLVWIFIDEAHEFLPKEGKTSATDALIQILREGRQPGLSMALATQQPGKIHTDVMTQADIVLSHRVTAKPDMEALNLIMQTYLLESITQFMNELPKSKGSAIILDDNSERIYPMRVRARYTWHGGESPAAIRASEKLI
jgi:hypothetical protein